MGKVFHAFLMDAPDRRFVGDTAVPIHKKLVATFAGAAYVAEREGDSLNIFLTSSEMLPTGAIGDAAPSGGPMTATKLQTINEAARKRAGYR